MTWSSAPRATRWSSPSPELLDLQEVPDLSPVAESSFWSTGMPPTMAPGRGIVLVGTQSGEPVAEELEIEVATRAGGRTRLTLTDKPAHEFDRQSAVVFGNAARATHGETVTQLLGSGDARVPFAAVAPRAGAAHLRAGRRRPAAPLRRSRCESTTSLDRGADHRDRRGPTIACS